VGFCKVHANYSALSSFTPKIVGSLHAVQVPKSIYIVDESLSLVKVYPVDHESLEGLGDDDHSQYQTKEFTKNFTGNLSINSLSIASSGTGNGDPIGDGHVNNDWESAHGAGTMGGKHFVKGSVYAQYIVASSATATGRFRVTSNGNFSLPFALNDGGGSATGWHDLIVDGNGDIGFWDNGSSSWWDGVIRYGIFS
jgi:hypothetical protein